MLGEIATIKGKELSLVSISCHFSGKLPRDTLQNSKSFCNVTMKHASWMMGFTKSLDHFQRSTEHISLHARKREERKVLFFGMTGVCVIRREKTGEKSVCSCRCDTTTRCDTVGMTETSRGSPEIKPVAVKRGKKFGI